jgi:hypothetical protein
MKAVDCAEEESREALTEVASTAMEPLEEGWSARAPTVVPLVEEVVSEPWAARWR